MLVIGDGQSYARQSVKLSDIQDQTHGRAGQGKVNVWAPCRNLAWGSITLPSVHEAGLPPPSPQEVNVGPHLNFCRRAAQWHGSMSAQGQAH